ncbi:MAG: glucose-6-phosphate isomerase [Rhodobacteraceae bacterium]|jgi:glucose-6-phosphate isomerase|uniref:Glucose-6-phosphate isomerase n=1 Tax=Salipiger profundus TaxID=1229727 RepID=A0A1U7DA50_9RHOB|nr:MULTISPECIES: glucose-6-phosphate isomerase [Salipiger]APX25057.1 glucose-6-phosphate isomerase [Salipiger profundus]MAB07564.1 glucose-6-phosphate isomerase [Paracoccaceae bacterium]GGA15088.1 glucose-6-phosphate isomerase [Salipiger profundus]SFD11785.1 glucose-6-phosphate isomerase [Salipiger profundus]
MFETLKSLAAARDGRRIDALFEQDAERAATFSIQHDGLLFDYSKTQLDSEVVEALLAVAEGADVAVRRDAMFNGQKINETEGRAVLHTALRNLDGAPVLVEGEDVMPEVLKTLARMEAVAHEIRGSEITDVVNIGIGGSDLGPKMGAIALSPYHDGPRCHFVSNVDGADIADTLKGCNPETTLFIIASKTFTTIETMTNARTAWDWLEKHDVSTDGKFVALSSNKEKAGEWGIPESRVFGFEDWVGGRYSMWGPIGLSLMIAVGPEDFRAFLRGGLAMDTHFREAPLAENMPVMLALVGVWHNQVLGHATRAVLPYDNRLSRLPAYLQQLEMESNGKGVSMDGADLAFNSGPVVWGEPGTNGQHAFYQLIHQGTRVVPCEFMVAAKGHEPELAHHHALLIANCFAQSEALMRGRTLDEAREKVAGKFEGDELERQAKHRVFPGNRPSTTLVYETLDPETLGKIVALYEHRVFVEGVILNINSYDQWGVELGKELATTLGPMVTGEQGADGKDGSTRQLLAFVHNNM